MNTIKILKDANGYTFKTPIHSKYIYKIEEKILQLNTIYTIDYLPIIKIYIEKTVVKRIHATRVNIPYITVEEYFNREAEFEKKKILNEFDEYEWKSLEDEYQYKIFKRDYETVIEPILVYIGDIALELEEYIEPPNKYIIPHRHLGGDILSIKGCYNRHSYIIDIIHQILKKHNFVNEENKEKPSIPNKIYTIYTYNLSNSISLNINHKLIFDIPCKDMSDNIDKLIKQMEEDYNFVREKIELYIKMNDCKFVNFYDILLKYKTILDKVKSLDVKSKSYDSKNALISYLNKTIKEFESVSNSL